MSREGRPFRLIRETGRWTRNRAGGRDGAQRRGFHMYGGGRRVGGGQRSAHDLPRGAARHVPSLVAAGVHSGCHLRRAGGGRDTALDHVPRDGRGCSSRRWRAPSSSASSTTSSSLGRTTSSRSPRGRGGPLSWSPRCCSRRCRRSASWSGSGLRGGRPQRRSGPPEHASQAGSRVRGGRDRTRDKRCHGQSHGVYWVRSLTSAFKIRCRCAAYVEIHE